MFSNLRVIELASVLAGPGVGQFFAELGAEVIKVENKRTGGDVTRSWKLPSESPDDDRPAYFCSVNWGKKSLAIDLSTDEGKEVLNKLISKADVVIASYKPGDARKLGMSYEQLKVVNDTIIYGQLSGYGSDNDRVGYDAVIQAESGLMDMNGEKDGEPLKMPVALVDVLAGHQLKEGLLLALLKKERTGEGSLVEVSLLQSAIASLVNQSSAWLVAHSLPVRKGSLHPSIAPYGETFMTVDDKRIILAIGSDRQFMDLCEVLSLNEYSSDERFSTNQKRVIHRAMLKELLAMKIDEWTSTDLLAAIHKKKIPAGIVQSVSEALNMNESKELYMQHGEMVGIRSYVGKQNDPFMNRLTPPPHLGEHTDEILNSL